MNGIEKITDKIAAEAQLEIDAILASARLQAEAIAEEYSTLAETEEQELLRVGAEAADDRVQRQARTERLEAKKTILAAKQELISQAYDRAKEQIFSLDTASYVAFLARQAAEAAATGRETVILSAADRQKVGAQLVAEANARLAAQGRPAALALSPESREIAGGLILKSGNVEVNCTLDKLLEMSRSRLDAQVASVLFG